MIRKYQESDRKNLIPLISDFRLNLAEFKEIKQIQPNFKKAEEELDDYLEKNYPIFIAVDSLNKILGYMVCRIIDNVIWVESLYVTPNNRRSGVGSALYAEAELLGEQHQSDTLYNWIHPNNEVIVKFLQKKGYSVLNLIELRKKHPNEKINKKIRVNNYEFDY